MSVDTFLLFAIPAVLVMVKLAAVSFAVVWLVRGVFEAHCWVPAAAIRPMPAAQPPRKLPA